MISHRNLLCCFQLKHRHPQPPQVSSPLTLCQAGWPQLWGLKLPVSLSSVPVCLSDLLHASFVFSQCPFVHLSDAFLAPAQWCWPEYRTLTAGSQFFFLTANEFSRVGYRGIWAEGRGGKRKQRKKFSTKVLRDAGEHPSQRVPWGGRNRWNCRRNLWAPVTCLGFPWESLIHSHYSLSPSVEEGRLEQEELSYSVSSTCGRLHILNDSANGNKKTVQQSNLLKCTAEVLKKTKQNKKPQILKS